MRSAHTATKILVATLTFSITSSFALVALATHAPPGTKLWAYQAAAAAAQMARYDIGTDTFDSACVPDGTANGRGVAQAPDLNLWYTRVSAPPFYAGDGLVHKATPPPVCGPLGAIPFIDGPGGFYQDDVGALDTDPDDGNLWAAGYKPCDTTGDSATCDFFSGTDQFLYKVDQTTGALLQWCHIPKGDPSGGNDSLAVATIAGLGKVLLTDGAEWDTTGLSAVLVSSCTSGNPGTVVASYTLPNGFRGIDYDFTTGTLIGTDTSGGLINDYGPPPFATVTATMSSTPVFDLEDISLSIVGSVLPTQGKGTGGGQPSGPKANFGFNAKVSGGTASGHLEYNVKGGATYHCEVTLVTLFTPTAMEFDVDCRNSSIHHVKVEDNREPGRGADKFFFDGVGGTLVAGNIQIHKQ